jgi:hypothetical protein
MKRELLNPQSGAALIMALLFTTVLVILMLALFTTRINELRSVSRNVQLTQAQLIAEAGVDNVLGAIARDGGYKKPPYDIPRASFDPLAPGEQFQTSVSYEEELRLLTITSTGWDVTENAFTIEVQIRLDSRSTEGFAFVTCSNLNLEGNMQINDGSVYVGKELLIQEKLSITNGSAMAKGNILLKGHNNVRDPDKDIMVEGNLISSTGRVYSTGGRIPPLRANGYAAFGTSTIPAPGGDYKLLEYTQAAVSIAEGAIRDDYALPDFCDTNGDLYATWYRDVATIVGTSEGRSSIPEADDDRLPIANPGEAVIEAKESPWTISSPLASVPENQQLVYFVDGDLVVSGTWDWEGPVTFYVTGKLTFNGGASLSDPTFSNAFYVEGDVIFEGGAHFDGFIYANGKIEAAGTATLSGAMMSLSDDSNSFVKGGMTIDYQETRNPRFGDRLAFNIQRWRLINNPL